MDPLTGSKSTMLVLFYKLLCLVGVANFNLPLVVHSIQRGSFRQQDKLSGNQPPAAKLLNMLNVCSLFLAQLRPDSQHKVDHHRN